MCNWFLGFNSLLTSIFRITHVYFPSSMTFCQYSICWYNSALYISIFIGDPCLSKRQPGINDFVCQACHKRPHTRVNPQIKEFTMQRGAILKPQLCPHRFWSIVRSKSILNLKAQVNPTLYCIVSIGRDQDIFCQILAL